MGSPRAAPTVALPLVVALVLVAGAFSRRVKSNVKHESFVAPHAISTVRSQTQCQVGEFCGCAAKNNSAGLWSKDDVQSKIGALIQSPAMLCSPRSSYAVAYLAMTAERDAARCDPEDSMAMFPQTPQATILNDALSDIMTRYFVAIAEGTAPGADVDGIWADLYKDGEAGNFNALHIAMASTAIYLTSHMGLALSALPHAEDLWEGTQFATIKERVEYLESDFKPTYDAFNQFLANHIETVGRALKNAGMVGGQTCEITAVLVGAGSGPLTLLFEGIRTRTFELGMKVALDMDIGTHPLTQTRSDGKAVMRTNMDVPGTLVPPYGSWLVPLAKHARFWRRWLGDALGPIYRHASGAMNYEELSEGSVNHNACLARAQLAHWMST